MNKVYIKRQLSLRNIGFDINPEIELYDNIFDSIFDSKYLSYSLSEKSLVFDGCEIWIRKDRNTIYYNEKERTLSISSDLYNKYQFLTDLYYLNVDISLIAFFEYYIKINIVELQKY